MDFGVELMLRTHLLKCHFLSAAKKQREGKLRPESDSKQQLAVAEMGVGRPFGHNRHEPKSGGGAVVPLSMGGVGSPSNTMSPGPKPTSVPSGILIQPTV